MIIHHMPNVINSITESRATKAKINHVMMPVKEKNTAIPEYMQLRPSILKIAVSNPSFFSSLKLKLAELRLVK